MAVLLLTCWGVSALECLRWAAYLAVAVAFPGWVAWRLLGPVLRYRVEELAVGTALGYVLETVMRLVGTAAGVPALVGDLLPVMLALAVVAHPRARATVWGPRAGRMPLTLAWTHAVVLIGVMVWFGFSYFARQPLSWTGQGGPENDLIFALGLVGEAAHRWPLEFPWVQGEPLLYHWFFAEHLASAHDLTGVSLPTLLLRLEILPAVAVVAMSTSALAVRLSGRSWAGPLAVVLLLVVQDASPIALGQLASNPQADLTGVPYDVIMWWSTSGAYAAVVFAPAAILVVEIVRGGARRGCWALLLLVLVVGIGAKASVLPVVLAGSGLAALAAWRRERRIVGPALGVLALAGSVFAAGWWLLYGGQSQALLFSPLRHVLTTPLGSAVLAEGVEGRSALVAAGVMALCLVAMAAPFGGLAILPLSPALRRDPAAQVCLGAAVLSVAAVVLLFHEGQSNVYFLRTSLPLLAAASVWAMCASLPRGRAARGALGVAFCAGLLAMAAVSTRRWTTFGDGESSPARLLQAAVPFLLLAAIGALLAVFARRWSRRRLWGAAAVGALLVAYLAGLGAVRITTQAAAWAVTHPWGWSDTGPSSAQQIDGDAVRAAQWLRDHSRPTDVVVTNAFCRNGPTRAVEVCDNRTFWVAAYTERRTLVSGWGYTATANRLAAAGNVSQWQVPYWDTARLDRVRDFLASPTEADASQLSQSGARWVLAVPGFDPVSPRLGDVATEVHRVGQVKVYRLPG